MPLVRASAWFGAVASQSTFRNQTSGACCAAQPCGDAPQHPLFGQHRKSDKSL